MRVKSTPSVGIGPQAAVLRVRAGDARLETRDAKIAVEDEENRLCFRGGEPVGEVERGIARRLRQRGRSGEELLAHGVEVKGLALVRGAPGESGERRRGEDGERTANWRGQGTSCDPMDIGPCEKNGRMSLRLA